MLPLDSALWAERHAGHLAQDEDRDCVAASMHTGQLALYDTGCAQSSNTKPFFCQLLLELCSA